jgi:hypothetical protein
VEKVPQFAPGDIVWAKVRGHAWWPAKVGEICGPNTAKSYGGKPSNEIKYLIFFIEDRTRSQLNEKCIRPFEGSFFEFSFIAKSKKTLGNSIRKACWFSERIKAGMKERLLQRLADIKNKNDAASS